MEEGRRAPSTVPEDGARHLPNWFTSFEGLAWAVDARGLLVFVNSAVERALGKPAAEWIGVPCESLFRLRDHGGESFCRQRCIREDPQRHCALPASLISDSPVGELRLCLIEHCPNGSAPIFLHLAEQNHVDPAVEYLEALAHRSAEPTAPTFELTPTELRVMAGLCRDQTVGEIAEQLHCSVVTVRNHIQHILRKLGAHSIPEAVARYLLRHG